MEEFPELRIVVDKGLDNPANVDLALEYIGKSHELSIEQVKMKFSHTFENIYVIKFAQTDAEQIRLSIGPFCVVGSSPVLGNDCKLHPGSHVCGNTRLGDKCILMSGAIVGDNLPGKRIIRCNNVIGHHAVVGIKCQDMKYKVVRLLDLFLSLSYQGQVMNAFLKLVTTMRSWNMFMSIDLQNLVTERSWLRSGQQQHFCK
nr:probable acyl-[acyl-carrier-protein]--UDP-N-acetylglucosamine O-acyltransferase, mitochondrial isoform X1 [Tanacetum cinerariifolium]